MSNGPAHIQTVSEASTSISNVAQSTFSSLANTLGLPQLRDSFFQNIIYILIVIIILIGILVYIQMVGPSGNNPLNLPPTKEIKKVEIRKIVEGFDITDTSRIDSAAHAETMVGHDEHDYNHNDLHLAHTEDYEEQFSKRKRH